MLETTLGFPDQESNLFKITKRSRRDRMIIAHQFIGGDKGVTQV